MKNFFMILIGFVCIAVLISVAGRAFQAAPTPAPDSAVVVVEAERIVSTAAAGGSVEISDQTIEVIGVADQVADLGAHALDVQAQVASDGFDAVQNVAQSGYAANVAISATGTFGTVATVALVVAGILGFVYIASKMGEESDKQAIGFKGGKDQ